MRKLKSDIQGEPAAFPHITRDWTTAGMMRDVLIALGPVVIGSIFYNGMRALAVLAVSIAVCLGVECCVCLARRKPMTVSDGSAAVTGLILALTLPAGISLPAVAVGALFAILVVKSLFGGLGRNFLNPALAGRAVIALVWPAAFLSPTVDTSSDLFRLLTRGPADAGGAIGAAPAMLLLLGAAYLYLRGVILLTAPLASLGSAVFLYWAFGGEYLLQGDPVAFLFSGGLLLGSFFLVTDPVTSPATRVGRLVFGLGTGFLTALFILWGTAPAGIFEAILVLNAASPLIERFTRSRPSGTGGSRYEKSK